LALDALRVKLIHKAARSGRHPVTKYHKIQSVFKRDPEAKNKRFLMWDYSMPEFEYLAHNHWVGTEKIDGTNIRIYGKNEGGFIAGKTNNAQIYQGLFAHLETVRDRLIASDLPDDIVLYGEGYGAKIQSGGHYIPDGQSFALFDVMIGSNFQPRSSVLDVAIKLDLPVCPLIGQMTLVEWVYAIESGEFRDSILHPGAKNEGVVLRPMTELKSRCGDRIITKLKFKDFGL
jgi:RNA ligase